MRRIGPTFALLLALALALSSLSGCQDMRQQFQLKTTVSDPEEGTPKWVIFKAIEAALMEDEAAAWVEYKKVLHSSEFKSLQNVREWRQLRFSTMRRKVRLYTEEGQGATYQFRYMNEQDDGAIRLFVHNEGDPELPTPCRLRKDPENGGAWRIYNCSL